MRADATIQIRLQTVKVITKHFLGHEAQHVPRLLKWLGTESHQILDCMRQTIFFVLVLSFFLTSSSGCSRVNGLVPCSVIYRVIAARSYKRPYSAKTGPRKYSWVMGQIKLSSSSSDIVQYWMELGMSLTIDRWRQRKKCRRFSSESDHACFLVLFLFLHMLVHNENALE